MLLPRLLEVRTQRLLLRPWRERDLEAFAAINADPRVPGNQRSRRVMDKLGMRREPGEFDHPRLPEGHRLRRHVLYRVSREQWSSASSVT
jgi:RimJ/RimL family protein N-acetyltransferase